MSTQKEAIVSEKSVCSSDLLHLQSKVLIKAPIESLCYVIMSHINMSHMIIYEFILIFKNKYKYSRLFASLYTYRTSILNCNSLQCVCFAEVVSNQHFGLLISLQIIVRSILLVILIRERSFL